MLVRTLNTYMHKHACALVGTETGVATLSVGIAEVDLRQRSEDLVEVFCQDLDKGRMLIRGHDDLELAAVHAVSNEQLEDAPAHVYGLWPEQSMARIVYGLWPEQSMAQANYGLWPEQSMA